MPPRRPCTKSQTVIPEFEKKKGEERRSAAVTGLSSECSGLTEDDGEDHDIFVVRNLVSSVPESLIKREVVSRRFRCDETRGREGAYLLDEIESEDEDQGTLGNRKIG